MNISNNISSIQSHQTMMNTNANNVANVNTEGFIPQDTRISENGNVLTTNTRKADDKGSSKSQTDLAKEIPDQLIALNATAANIGAIKTQDEMLGSLLDIKA
ncbi:flagellar basal body protein [bacterium]|nr:flagellar basal body protein [bacterium]MBU1995450.1 flagellar basal body protein [bacterium]